MGIEKAVILNGTTAVLRTVLRTVRRRRIADKSNNFSIFLLIFETLHKISKKTIPRVKENSTHYFYLSGGAQTGGS